MFLRARFALDYLSSVARKRLYHDLEHIVLPVPMYTDPCTVQGLEKALFNE